MAGLTPLDGSRRDAALPANPSLCLRPFAPVRGAAGLRGVPLVMPLTHSQSATGGIHLVLLCVYWLTVLRGWGRDRHYLPDTQLRALPTQSLINSVQLSSWPLSAHPALSPCRAPWCPRHHGRWALPPWTQSWLPPIWDLRLPFQNPQER